MKNSILLFLAAFFVGLNIYAQPPSHCYKDTGNISFYEIVSQIEAHNDTTGIDTIPHSGYKQFKRWEWEWSRLKGVNGNAGNFSQANAELLNIFDNQNLICDSSSNYNKEWSFLGHNYTNATTNSENTSRGQGILRSIFVDINNDPSRNTIYVGAGTSGLWKTINANSATPIWSCLTDNYRIPALGVNSIAVNPDNPNTIYISTGTERTITERVYGLGIIKTTNGGATWGKTGLSSIPSSTGSNSYLNYTTGVFIAPWDTSEIFAIRMDELYRSTNGGVNFSLIHKIPIVIDNEGVKRRQTFNDIIFLSDKTILVSTLDNTPINSNTLIKWQGGAKVFKGVFNSGNYTLTDITNDVFSGAPNNGIHARIDIAKYPKDENIIYFSSTHSEGFKPIYIGKTEDKLQTFNPYKTGTFQVSNPQNCQIHYNDLKVSHHNSAVIYLGGETTGVSVNSGASFTNLFDYYSGIAHVDQREILVLEGASGEDLIYCANDGGVDASLNSGTTWKKLNGIGLNISQTMGLGVSNKGDWFTTGLFDMGIYDSSKNQNWKCYDNVGDGFSAEFNPYTEPQTMFTSVSGSPPLYKIKESAPFDKSFIGNRWGKSLEVGPLGNMFYGSKGEIRQAPVPIVGNTLSLLFVLAGEGEALGLGVCQSNPNVFYAGFSAPKYGLGKSNRFFRSMNVLSEFPNLPIFEDMSTYSSFNLPLEDREITDIKVDHLNENNLWVLLGSGIDNSGSRVFYSDDGGKEFTELEKIYYCDNTTIMPWPIGKIIIDEATGGMYAGTDVGVYYNADPKNMNSPWEIYNKDLPLVAITDMEINYCQRKLYISTYGRGIWASDLAEEPDQEMVIDNNTTWERDVIQIINQDVRVKSGSVLTITSEILMPTDAKIIVEKGAQLIVDGGTITSRCNEPWGGIFVAGTPNSLQTNAQSGVVILRNQATLSNASTAVNLIGVDNNGNFDWNATGGVLAASNSNFVNNRRDIQFLSFHRLNGSGNEYSNRSYVTSCTFKGDNKLIIPLSNLAPHITMWDVNGVRIQDCTFEEEDFVINKRDAIGTIDAGFNIIGAPSTFTNQKRAIDSYGGGISTKGVVSIKGATFNCEEGIYLEGVKGAQVTGNIFDIEHKGFNIFNQYPYGIYLDLDCNGFNTEGNTFNGISNNSGTNITEGAAGIVVRNSGAEFNEYYRSTFNDIHTASQALSFNRKGEEIGLEFRCNTFTNNVKDVDIRDDSEHPALNANELGIHATQGSSDQLPDNSFNINTTNTLLNIANKGNDINYWYRGSTAQSNPYYPYFLTTSSVNTVLENGVLPNCPNNIATYGGNSGNNQNDISLIRADYQNSYNAYYLMVDNGNTSTLLYDIDNANGTTITSVYNNLMAISPYLSIEVLEKVASQDAAPFTTAIVYDVLNANPHAGRSLAVMNAVENRVNPLTSSQLSNIEINKGLITSRDSFLSVVSSYGKQHDALMHELHYALLQDSNFNLAEKEEWFKHPINPSYHYTLAEMWWNSNNLSKFNEVVDSIPLLFALSNEEDDYHNSFTSFYSELTQWRNNGENMYKPDVTKRDWLLNFESQYSRVPSRLYGLLKVNDTSLLIANVYIDNEIEAEPEPETDQEIILDLKDLENENNQSLINLYPNPAKKLIHLEWKEGFKETKVTVLDMNGKVVLRRDWNKEEKMSINISTLSKGSYFIHLKDEEGINITRKLVILE